MDDPFNRCVVRHYRSGWHEIKCCLGLWSVTGPAGESLDNEARRYWIQYYQDGEYDKHLATSS
jgi:hypothetical protein